VLMDRNSKAATLDRKPAVPLQYLGYLNVFLFSYPLLEVIRGGPEERRKFIDRAIAMSRPAYLPVLVNYHRALRQKTAILQGTEPARKDVLAAFNQQLLQHGLEIVQYRLEYLDRLRELLREKQALFFEIDRSLNLELRS